VKLFIRLHDGWFFHFTFDVSNMDAGTQLARSHEIGIKIGLIFRRRTRSALEKFNLRATEAIT